jgi:hypothetical protein
MSFNASSDTYTPPPPKRGMSPWAWVGIGCGSFLLLGFVGCGIAGYKLTQAMNNAMSPEESEKAIVVAGIPLYPGATIDPAATKAAGGVMSLMGGMTGGKMKMAMAAYRCPDESDKVISFYNQKLIAAGYSERVSPSPPNVRSARQVQFTKGDAMAMVQTQAPEGNDKGCVLVLAHMTGLPKRGK